MIQVDVVTSPSYNTLWDENVKLKEKNRKLREAVIYERARYIWGHRKCEDEKVAFAVAERELRAEGVIE